jgi:hypothetical protein
VAEPGPDGHGNRTYRFSPAIIHARMGVTMINKAPFFLAAACVLLTSCASEPPKPKEPEKPPAPVTGRYALQQMFIAARSWAQDLEIASMNSMHFSQIKDEPGKSGGWQVTFVSPSLQQSRTYTWAAAEISISIHKGITDERPNSWSGGKSFPIAAIHTDTDAAYQTAVKKVTKYADKPDTVITYQLQKSPNSPDPSWRIIWGENVATSSDSVLVDASTGEYSGTLH